MIKQINRHQKCVCSTTCKPLNNEEVFLGKDSRLTHRILHDITSWLSNTTCHVAVLVCNGSKNGLMRHDHLTYTISDANINQGSYNMGMKGHFSRQPHQTCTQDWETAYPYIFPECLKHKKAVKHYMKQQLFL